MQKHIYSKDGVFIHYDISENFKPKGALIFLHGLGGSLTAFDPIRELLEKEGYSTLAIDIRGQGYSGRPVNKRTYTLNYLSEDVIAVLEVEQVDNFILIGHCFGGVIAMAVNDKIPERIKKLILIDTNYKAPRWANMLYRIPGFPILMKVLVQLMPKWHREETIDYQKYSGGGDYNIPRIFSDITHTSLRSYLLLSQTLLRLDLQPVIRTFHIPTLIIEGTKDTIYPPQIAEKLHVLIPHSELTYIENANHILVITNYKKVGEVISEYLRRTV